MVALVLEGRGYSIRRALVGRHFQHIHLCLLFAAVRVIQDIYVHSWPFGDVFVPGTCVCVYVHVCVCVCASIQLHRMWVHWGQQETDLFGVWSFCFLSSEAIFNIPMSTSAITASSTTRIVIPLRMYVTFAESLTSSVKYIVIHRVLG